MKDIAIFGGTFDPPTRAHEAIIAACLQRSDLDEVWVMPSGSRPDKPGMRAAAGRLAMLQLVQATTFAGETRLRLTDFEQRLNGPTQTFQTVRALKRTYPRDRFWFVFGADSYAHMPTWKHGQMLQTTLNCLLVPRPGYDIPLESERLRCLDVPHQGVAISSTMARELYLRGQLPGEHVLNPAVAQYIGQQALYGREQLHA